MATGFIPKDLFAPSNIFNNLFWGTILSIALSAPVRASIAFLFRKTLDRKQEIAFWLTVPASLLIAILALRFGTQSAAIPDVSSLQSTISEIQAQRWHRLTKDDAAGLKGTFSQIGIHQINLDCNCSDCCWLAQDYSGLFQSLGWSQPYGPGQSVDSIGSSGISVSGPKSEAATIAILRREIGAYSHTNVLKGRWTDSGHPNLITIQIGFRTND